MSDLLTRLDESYKSDYHDIGDLWNLCEEAAQFIRELDGGLRAVVAENKDLWQRIHAHQAELNEQASLHGMGSEREAKQLTRIRELKAALSGKLPEHLSRDQAEPICSLTCVQPCDMDCDCNPEVQSAWAVLRERLIGDMK